MRWDEWLPFITTRIAPFRTRTLHVPQHFHTLPTPNVQTLPAVRTSLPHILELDIISDYSANGTERRSERERNDAGNEHKDSEIEIESSGKEGGRKEGEVVERSVEDTSEGNSEGRKQAGVKTQESSAEVKNETEVEPERAENERLIIEQESILSLLPTVSRMMRTLQPRIEAVARIAVEVYS